MLKIDRIRDKKYRMFIASLPCTKCKLEGSTQAAHIGKGGMGLKGDDDTIAPLCTVKFVGHGYGLGCHEKLDRHIESRYWDEMKPRLLATARQAYELWSIGKKEEAAALFGEF